MEEDIIEKAENLLEKRESLEVIKILKDIEVPDAYVLRSKAYYNLGNKENAIKELEKGIEKFPFSHYLHYELALIFFIENELNKALDEIEKALSIIPFSYDYNKLKAKILFKMEDYEKAYEILVFVNKLKPDDIESRIMRAECFYKTGKYLDALYEINRALQYDNRNHLLHYLKGKVYLETGYFKLAISEFKIAISISPSAEYYYYLALAEYMNKEYDKAINDINKAISIDPNNSKIKEFYESLKNMNK